MPEPFVEMALFPLETVLFPDSALQLHIFEERYRQMVRDCVEKSTPFGIVLVRSGPVVGDFAEPYMVGTTAVIDDIHPYSDGRMDIRVLGLNRFRIRKLDYSRPYLTGLVEPVEDIPPPMTEVLETLITEAKEYFVQFIQGIVGTQENVVEFVCPDDPIELSFKIAGILQIENIERQRLLEMTVTQERFAALVPMLRQHLEEIDDYLDQYRTGHPVRLIRVTSEDLRDWSGPN